MTLQLPLWLLWLLSSQLSFRLPALMRNKNDLVLSRPSPWLPPRKQIHNWASNPAQDLSAFQDLGLTGGRPWQEQQRRWQQQQRQLQQRQQEHRMKHSPLVRCLKSLLIFELLIVIHDVFYEQLLYKQNAYTEEKYESLMQVQLGLWSIGAHGTIHGHPRVARPFPITAPDVGPGLPGVA